MSKHAVIAAISTRMGESQETVNRFLDAWSDEIIERLRLDGETLLPRLGKLKMVDLSGHPKGANWRFKIDSDPFAAGVAFSAEKSLRQALRED
jgi:nucleoid DNA-binding protein